MVDDLPISKKHRNAHICQLYRDGLTQKELAFKFKITRARVWQILRREDILRGHENRKEDMSARTAIIGFYVEPNIKDAMQRQAKTEGISLSQLMHRFACKGLDELGVSVTPVKDERMIPLPLEPAS